MCVTSFDGKARLPQIQIGGCFAADCIQGMNRIPIGSSVFCIKKNGRWNRTAAMTYIFIFDRQITHVIPYLTDCAIRHSEKKGITVFRNFFYTCIVSALCKFCGLLCGGGCAAVITADFDAVHRKIFTQCEADLSGSDKTCSHTYHLPSQRSDKTRYICCHLCRSEDTAIRRIKKIKYIKFAV